MSLDITLLGDVTLRGSDPATPPEPVRPPQIRVAFARLVLGRHAGVTRDSLADAVWPGGLPATWGPALRTIVSLVRGLVRSAGASEDALVTRGGIYMMQLPADTVVDVEAAEEEVAAAQQAVAEHRPAAARRLAASACDRLRRPFLPNHDGDWVAAQRARLTEFLAIGLETVSQAASACRDDADAVSAAREAIARAPLRESAHRCLMSALARGGDRAEALRVYQRLRRTLCEELGVDPEPATERTYLELLGPPLAAARVTVGAGSRPVPAEAAGPFVGRDTETAVAVQAWERALTGAGRVLFVTGEAGIGKTRFAADLALRATTTGGLVLFGRCDRDAVVPYQPFVEMLDPLVEATPAGDLPRLGPTARAALAPVFPAFAGRGCRSRPGTETEAGTEGIPVLFDAVAKLVAWTARTRPLLAVFDDVQWADDGTLRLLRHVVRQATASARLLVVVLARDDGPADDAIVRLADELRRATPVERLRLRGIGAAAAKALARQLAPDADHLVGLAPRLAAEAAGNPLVLVELLRADREEGASEAVESVPVPPALDDLVNARLAAVGPAGRELLNAAAVVGSRFELDVVAATAGLGTAAALDALDAAVTSGLVVEADPRRGDTYRFAQAIARRVLYGRLTGARRRDLHGRAADAIERLPGDRVAEIAHHRSAAAGADGDGRAVRAALAAAGSCVNDMPAEAVRWCRRALDHVPPGDIELQAAVLTELGLALARLDDPGAGATLFDAAIRAGHAGATALAARAALGLTEVAGRRPEVREETIAAVHDVLTTGTPALGDGPAPPVALARLVARDIQLRGAGPSGPAPGGRPLAAATVALRRRLGELEGPDARNERAAVAEDLAVLADAAGDREAAAIAHHHRAMAAAVAGDSATTEDALGRLRDTLAASAGHPGHRLIEERGAAVAATVGRLAAVRAAAGHGAHVAGAGSVDAAGQLGRPPPGAMTRHQAVVAAWLRGRVVPEWTGEVAPNGNGHADGDGDGHGDGLLTAERALAALAAGQRGRARTLVHALTMRQPAAARDDRWLHEIALVALAAAELDDPAVALDLYRRLAPYSALTCGVGYRSYVGNAALHLGRLAAVAGEWGDAERHLAAALRQLSSIGARPWLALAQDELARVLEARGRSSDRRWIAPLRTQARRLAGELRLQHPDARRLAGSLRHRWHHRALRR